MGTGAGGECAPEQDTTIFVEVPIVLNAVGAIPDKALGLWLAATKPPSLGLSTSATLSLAMMSQCLSSWKLLSSQCHAAPCRGHSPHALRPSWLSPVGQVSASNPFLGILL